MNRQPMDDEDAWEPGSTPPRPRGSVACEWCSFWHFPGEEECPDAP